MFHDCISIILNYFGFVFYEDNLLTFSLCATFPLVFVKTLLFFIYYSLFMTKVDHKIRPSVSMPIMPPSVKAERIDWEKTVAYNYKTQAS